MIDTTALKWLDVGATVLDTAGRLAAGKAASIAGQRTQSNKAFEAWQLEQASQREFAYSQRLAIDEVRNADYVASRALAMAGASGAGVSDPTVMGLVGNIHKEGAYRAAIRLYQGEESSRLMRLRAKAAELEGNDALQLGDYTQRAYQIEAIGALGEGAQTIYSRYYVPRSGG